MPNFYDGYYQCECGSILFIEVELIGLRLIEGTISPNSKEIVRKVIRCDNCGKEIHDN